MTVDLCSKVTSVCGFPGKILGKSCKMLSFTKWMLNRTKIKSHFQLFIIIAIIEHKTKLLNENSIKIEI